MTGAPQAQARAAVDPLRGQGPRVFVSYSYADADAARTLGEHVAQAACRSGWRRKSTLLGRPLMEVLPQRIADRAVLGTTGRGGEHLGWAPVPERRGGALSGGWLKTLRAEARTLAIEVKPADARSGMAYTQAGATLSQPGEVS
jgi:hypothetical protein